MEIDGNVDPRVEEVVEEEVLLYIRFPHFEHTKSVLFGPPLTNRPLAATTNASSSTSSSSSVTSSSGGITIEGIDQESPVCTVSLGPGREDLRFDGSHTISLGSRLFFAPQSGESVNNTNTNNNSSSSTTSSTSTSAATTIIGVSNAETEFVLKHISRADVEGS